jgi:hypothetical protein
MEWTPGVDSIEPAQARAENKEYGEIHRDEDFRDNRIYDVRNDGVDGDRNPEVAIRRTKDHSMNTVGWTDTCRKWLATLVRNLE